MGLQYVKQFIDEKVATIKLLSKEDHISDDSITHEDKWSLYVDHFVQLHATENLRPSRKEPFLKRNLPTTIPDEPPHGIETRSGLEMKICVNTYKVFFVDHTEDYFARRKVDKGDFGAMKRRRLEKFGRWIESEGGWKRGAGDDEAKEMNNEFETWMKGSGNGVLGKRKIVEDGWLEYNAWERVSNGGGA